MFGEFQFYGGWQLLQFVVGAAICIFGTLIILKKYDLEDIEQTAHVMTTEELAHKHAKSPSAAFEEAEGGI